MLSELPQQRVHPPYLSAYLHWPHIYHCRDVRIPRTSYPPQPRSRIPSFCSLDPVLLHRVDHRLRLRLVD